MSAPTIAQLTTLGLVDAGPLHLDGAGVRSLLASAPHEGLTALLGAAIERGLVVTDDASAALVTSTWAESMARCVALDVLLQQVIGHLASVGIESRALKGAAVATLDEFDPAWRSYHDVDVLVPADRLLAAVDALAKIGLTPLVAPVGRRWAARHAKSLTLVNGAGVQVDVHRLLAAGVFGERLSSTRLFAGGQSFTVGASTVTALSGPQRFLHACYHAALGGARGARHRRDVLLLARRVDVPAVEGEWAHGWSPTVVADALRWAANDSEQVDERTSSMLPVSWKAWLDGVVSDDADLALLRAYAGTFGDQAGSVLRAAGGPLASLRYSWPLLWPSRAHLRARHRSRWHHMRATLSSRFAARRGRQSR